MLRLAVATPNLPFDDYMRSNCDERKRPGAFSASLVENRGFFYRTHPARTPESQNLDSGPWLRYICVYL